MENLMKWGLEQRLRDASSSSSSPWDAANMSFEKDRAYGFSWPQRNYQCSFCKREFKSAQALGGHMNVHRRDRARMRLSPSWDSPNLPNSSPNPNPNPNPNFPLPASSKLSMPTMLQTSSGANNSLVPQAEMPPVDPDTSALICRGDHSWEKKNKAVAGVEVAAGLVRGKDVRVWKAKELVRLDLNLGLNLIHHDGKDDLDLDLRLGYS